MNTYVLFKPNQYWAKHTEALKKLTTLESGYQVRDLGAKGLCKKAKFEERLSCYLLIPLLRTDRKYLVSFYPPKPEHFNFRNIFKGPSEWPDSRQPCKLCLIKNE